MRFRCALLVLTLVAPVVSAAVFEGRYRIALGDADRPVDNATVWVYVVSWGDLARVQAGVVRHGIVDVKLHSADITAPTPEVFLVAIEFPDGRWYRGPGFPPGSSGQIVLAEQFVEGFDAYFRGLAPTASSPARELTQVLPAFVTRRITLLNEDGSPLVGKDVPIDIYVTERNHCGVHRGLNFAEPLVTQTTDARGQITFVSQPGVMLHLTLLAWPRVSPPDSPWVWRELRAGTETDTTNDVVIRALWEDQRKTVTVEIRDHQGQPVSGHRVFWRGATRECGLYWNTFGPSNSNGTVMLEDIPAEATSEVLILRRGVGPEQPLSRSTTVMELSEYQRGQLIRDGRLAVTLPVPE